MGSVDAAAVVGGVSVRFRQRLKLQQNTPSLDAHGQPVESWSTYRHRMGNVKDTGGRELIRGEGIEANVTGVVEIRHPRQGRIPVAEDRVVFDENGTTRTLNIVAVKRRADGDRRFLDLYVRESP